MSSASRVISTTLRGRRLDIEYGILQAARSTTPDRICIMLPSSGTHFKMFRPLAVTESDSGLLRFLKELSSQDAVGTRNFTAQV